MLNISKGNMYDFVTHTWNTIKGECPHGCTYCYMTSWGKQKPVRIDLNEFKTDLGKGNFIFVGSSCDMFAKRIPFQWIADTLNHCKQFDNKYLFQSKNPARFKKDELPKNSIVCTTLETQRWYPEIMKNAPHPIARATDLCLLNMETYITIEPILDFDLWLFIDLIRCIRPVQVNIGADSGNNKLPEPEPQKIRDLINELSTFTRVKQKKNLDRLIR